MMPLVSICIAMLETPRRYLCEKFAKLADIQDLERRQFDEYAAEAMTRWFGAVFFHSKSGSADLILRAMKRSVTDVYKQLAKLDEPADLLHRHVGWRLSYECEETDPSNADMLDKVSKFVAVIERALARGHGGGRKAGVGQYPGVDALVFRLELGAQLAGGKFTVDKKSGKGTIIEALNLLRTLVVQTNVAPEKSWPQLSRSRVDIPPLPMSAPYTMPAKRPGSELPIHSPVRQSGPRPSLLEISGHFEVSRRLIQDRY